MSKEIRSAVVVLCFVVGIILAAARYDSSDSAAGETLAGAGAPPAKQSELLVASSFAPEGPAPVPAVDDLGTRHLTGHDGYTVALTFDDGPHPDYTPRVLEILRANDITATFCVLGSNVARYPELVREIAADGHVLCDHTVSHDMELPDRSEAEIDREIGGALASIHDVVPDAEVPFFRAPGGNFASAVNAVASSYGQQPLGWSVDPADWGKPGARTIHDYVGESIHPGAVVLLHDGGGDRSGTVTALPYIDRKSVV